MAVWNVWQRRPPEIVARTASECQFQPSGGEWARPKLGRRASSAPDAAGSVRSVLLRPSEWGGRPTRWHARPPNTDSSHLGVGGRAPDQRAALLAPPTREMAWENGCFGQLIGGASRWGGTDRHRMPIPASWVWGASLHDTVVTRRARRLRDTLTRLRGGACRGTNRGRANRFWTEMQAWRVISFWRTTGLEWASGNKGDLNDGHEWPGLASILRMGGAATLEVLRGTKKTWSLMQMELSDLQTFHCWFGSAKGQDRNCLTPTWTTWTEVSSSFLVRACKCWQARGACFSELPPSRDPSFISVPWYIDSLPSARSRDSSLCVACS